MPLVIEQAMAAEHYVTTKWSKSNVEKARELKLIWP